tara:strand:- start:186 stop:1250 length:1065 start_codon:yes stop_codon:yes gene_type:complete
MAYTTINKSTDYFNTKLYNGTGSTQSITGVGFQPDWCWFKGRNFADDHVSIDAVRGTNKAVYPNGISAETTQTHYFTSFDSDGYTLGNSGIMNGSGNTYASWNWKAGTTTGGTLGGAGTTPSAYSFNSTAGFSILKYTGDGGNSSLPHFLGAIPDMITVKNLTDSSTNWRSIFPNMVLGGASNGADYNLNLNTTNSWNNGTEFRDIMPDANIFRVSSADDVNKSGSQYIAYCFKNITGYSKVGFYTGNGNNDGTFVYTGFKPAFVMIKKTSGTESWQMTDSVRDKAVSPNFARLIPNSNSAEATNTTWAKIEKFSNGFKLGGTDSVSNGSGSTYIYMAFGQSLVGSNNVPATAR